MSIRLRSLFRSNPEELSRWSFSAVAVVIAHIVIAVAIVTTWKDSDESTDPVGAMVWELAPAPVAPTDDPSETTPGPEQVQAEATPERLTEPTEKPVEKIIEPDKVKEGQNEVPAQEKPEVALQQKVPEPTPEKPTPSEAQTAAPITTAPHMSRVETAPVAAAPMQTQFNLVSSNAIPTWTRQVASKLERNKRYPAAAQAKGERGVTELEFSVDRQGHLVSSRIVRSSGSDSLDRESLDLVRRAQPFTPPPASMTGDEVFLVVPIRFNNRS